MDQLLVSFQALLSGVAPSAIFIALFLVIMQYLKGKLTGNSVKDLINKALHQEKIEKTEQKVQDINKQQEQIVKEIQDHEEVVDKVTEKIDKVIISSNDKMENIQKESDIKKVDQDIQDKWSDI